MKERRARRKYSNTLEYINVSITFKIGESYFLKHNPDIIVTDDSAGNDIINAISNIQTLKCSTYQMFYSVIRLHAITFSFSVIQALLVMCVG